MPVTKLKKKTDVVFFVRLYRVCCFWNRYVSHKTHLSFSIAGPAFNLIKVCRDSVEYVVLLVRNSWPTDEREW